MLPLADYLPLILGGLVLMAFLSGFLLGHTRLTALENQGEAAVRRKLHKSVVNPRCHLMNNVTLPFEDGTTQIDHILVARTGIFVIETKHYTGWLFGSESSPTWTQVIYQKKTKFNNPIHQNRRHVRAVRELLDFLPAEHVRSVVVFTGDAEFKTPMPEGVMKVGGLIHHINQFDDDVISEDRMQLCVGRLECTRRLLSRQTDVEHQAYLDRKFGRAV